MPDNSSINIGSSLEIAGIEVRNRAFLAPMSGVTDVPFRNLAWKLGAGLVVSEMVASHALMEGKAMMHLKMQKADCDLHMVQLAGREAKWMELAAKMAAGEGADIIDINMGCPAKRVTTGYSGSALMRDLDHAMSLVEATVGAVDVPVTLKMRLGWDDQTINAPELAKRAEDAGVQMITVHGRTRCQFYKGQADWTKVKLVREAINVPLVINGDIVDSGTASSALEQSGADAVMIGRGTYGRPWQPGLVAGAINEQTAHSLITDPDIALGHHEAILSFYGLESGVRQARKHLGWYFDNLSLPKGAASLKRQILTSFDVSEIHKLVPELYAYAGAANVETHDLEAA